ncbi:MAG: hypothetical protein FJW23_01175 [Acidimicrobiia bacterium]|nr:hypothetical protein [Acidimicrobiia bacterium]
MTPRHGAAALVCLVLLAGAAAARAQQPAFTLLGSIPGRADLVEIHDGHAYVVDGKTLALFDLADPARPVRHGAYTFPEKIWGIHVAGPLVYVAADFFGLGVLDATDRAAPALRGALKTPGQAKSVALVGGTALVADHMSGVDVIDLGDGRSPVNRGAFFVEGYARDVVAAGSIVYAIDAPTGLYVFDLAAAERLDALEPISAQQSANSPASIEVATDVSPPLAVLVGGGALQVYDLSDPRAPRRAAGFKTPSGRPARATLRGAVAYVADAQEGLQVVDLSTPASPRVVGAYATPLPARDVAVDGSLVLVAIGTPEGEGRVLILRRER